MIGRLVTDGRAPATLRPKNVRNLRQPERARFATPSPAPDPSWEKHLRLDRVPIRVREIATEVYPVRWYRWLTATDERTCPECGALAGRTWSEQQPMPEPPLHVNCRCRVVLHRIEWRVREVAVWRTRYVAQPIWTWRRTGWQ